MTAATKTQPAKATRTKPETTEPARPQPKDPRRCRSARSRGARSQARERHARHLPYLAPGSDSRKAAESVAARRANGETNNTIVEDTKASIATVRRMVTNLELAQEIEAGEHADKWSVGDKQVVISVVEGKMP